MNIKKSKQKRFKKKFIATFDHHFNVINKITDNINDEKFHKLKYISLKIPKGAYEFSINLDDISYLIHVDSDTINGGLGFENEEYIIGNYKEFEIIGKLSEMDDKFKEIFSYNEDLDYDLLILKKH